MLDLSSAQRIEVGVDEAGRGPLAFDVVSAAVIMPHDIAPDDKMANMIKDSKKLSPKRRAQLSDYIKEKAVAYGIGIATVEEIDEHNILNATYMAMHRALDQVWARGPHGQFEHILVDGDRFKPYATIGTRSDTWVMHQTIVDGDNTRLDIAAASILAKHAHDTMIDELVAAHPDGALWKERYGFDTNKGYGTAKHMTGIKTYGITPYHRKSFAPCRI